MIFKDMWKSVFCLLVVLNTSVIAQQRVILDTDVDDVEALAMLHAYQNSDKIKLLGVIVTSRDTCAYKCVDAIDTYYGNPDIPIGFLKKQDGLENFSEYTRQISEEFPHGINKLAQTVESGKLYRKLLVDSPDNSVIVVTIGHLSSFQSLLRSRPDSISPLSGLDLTHKKIKKWLCMGGTYPKGKEANFYRPDPESTVYCIDKWKKEVVFCGWELGNEIITGGTYLKNNLTKDNPVYRAYELYNNFEGRPAWDQTAVLLLDKKSRSFFDFERKGFVKVDSDGSNQWVNRKNKSKKHAYVKIKKYVDPSEIAKYIDDLVLSLDDRLKN